MITCSSTTKAFTNIPVKRKRPGRRQQDNHTTERHQSATATRPADQTSLQQQNTEQHDTKRLYSLHEHHNRGGRTWRCLNTGRRRRITGYSTRVMDQSKAPSAAPRPSKGGAVDPLSGRADRLNLFVRCLAHTNKDSLTLA